MFKNRKVNRTQRAPARIIGHGTPFLYEEAFNGIRTNLQFAAIGKACKIFAVTSAIPNEGKSAVSINLAVSTARLGKRVCLIDCDMRCPIVHRYLHMENAEGQGILGALLHDAWDGETVRLEEYGIDVLAVDRIPPNPSELLASERMKAVLARLSERFDYIFIDTPPVGAVSDAAVLAPLTDGIILVVRQNFSTYAEVRQAKENLAMTGAHIVGAILNDYDVKTSGAEGYARHYYYYSSQKDGEIPGTTPAGAKK